MTEDELGDQPEGEGKIPSSVSAEIRARLLAGATREELESEGYNKNSIRTIASELKKETGSRGPIGKGRGVNGEARLQIYSKGSPPEALVDALDVPIELDGKFRTGMKFGIMSIITGIRIAQELSQIGVQQAKPLVDMARDMRSGEAAAARSAATEAAGEAATQVQNNLVPFLSQLESRLSGLERLPATGNPMQDMMVRMFEPMMNSVMQKIMPGLPQGKGPPKGWTTEQG